MKKIILISAFLLIALSCFSQEITPIQISRTYHIPGVTAEELYDAAYEWGRIRENYTDINCNRRFATSTNLARFGVTEEVFISEKNFGVSKLLGGDNTGISLTIDIYSFIGKFEVCISEIRVHYNPGLGKLYGENNVPSPLVYNKKQLKMAKEILFYVYQVAEEIFLDIENWMREKCPTPDSGVEIIP